MTLLVRKGTISNLALTTKTIGKNSNVRLLRCYTFRIDDTAVLLESPVNLDIAENDKVIAVGEMKRATLKVYSFKNENTEGHIYADNVYTRLLLFGICFIVLGFLTLAFFIGFILLLLGIFFIYRSTAGFRANQLLKAS